MHWIIWSRYIYTINTIQRSQSDKLRAKQQQLPKAGCREIGCLVPTGQISNMYHKYTVWTEFDVECSCSINMNYFLLVRVLHEYQYCIQMNVNIMGELAYFDSRCRELWGDAFEPWIFERWGSDSLTIRSLDHPNDKRQLSREIQPHWHMQQTVYMQLRTCFSNLFKCIRRSLVWSLTWSTSSIETFQMHARRTKIFAITDFLSIWKLLVFIKSE